MGDLINNYPGDTILVIYDVEFAFGQNFYIALTEEAKNAVLAKLKPAEEEKPAKKKKEKKEGEEGEADTTGVEEEEESESEDEFAGQTFEYKPPEPKEWTHLGSEQEIKEEQFVPSRKKLK